MIYIVIAISVVFIIYYNSKPKVLPKNNQAEKAYYELYKYRNGSMKLEKNKVDEPVIKRQLPSPVVTNILETFTDKYAEDLYVKTEVLEDGKYIVKTICCIQDYQIKDINDYYIMSSLPVGLDGYSSARCYPAFHSQMVRIVYTKNHEEVYNYEKDKYVKLW